MIYMAISVYLFISVYVLLVVFTCYLWCLHVNGDTATLNPHFSEFSMQTVDLNIRVYA